jgi:RPA family protein
MVNKVKIVRGTTNVLNITVNDETGAVYVLGAGEKIVFGVKCDHDDAEFTLLKTANFVADEGVYAVTLTPEDTDCLTCGDYVYDVALQSGANFFNVIEPSPFIIEPNVTTRGCAD